MGRLSDALAATKTYKQTGTAAVNAEGLAVLRDTTRRVIVPVTDEEVHDLFLRVALDDSLTSVREGLEAFMVTRFPGLTISDTE